MSRPQLGGWYVELTSPLTRASGGVADKAALTPFSFAAAGKLSGRPIGVLLGVVAAGLIRLFKPELTGDGWAEGAFLIFCMTAGDLLQRLVHWAAGWHVDPKLRHLAATREAELQFEKLVFYRRRRILSKADAERIAARIARADVAGGPKPRGPRGSYQKRIPPSVPPSQKTKPPPDP